MTDQRLVRPGAFPLPDLDDLDTREFWAACAEQRLVVQRCEECGEYRHAPVPLCHVCGSTSFEWTESAGRGSLFSWTVTHHAFLATASDSLPYVVAVVALDDCGGAKITSNLVGIDVDEITPNMAVDVVWCPTETETWLPLFRPRR